MDTRDHASGTNRSALIKRKPFEINAVPEAGLEPARF